MNNRPYLNRKRDRLYFRRRIPGLSTLIAPVTLALGTTDAALGNIWIGHLSQEFDLMLDQFIFMVPPLPEHLVARYFEDCLAACLSKLQRGRRLARMTGRSRDGYLENTDIQEAVLQSLIEDGICPRLPVSRINPEWSADQLSLAVHRYEREVRAILSPDLNTQIAAQFTGQTGISVRSLEHYAQLREAHLSAQLAAHRGAALATPPHAVPNLAPALYPIESAKVISVDGQPSGSVDPMRARPMAEASPLPAIPLDVPAKCTPVKMVTAPPHRSRGRSWLTISKLSEEFTEAHTLACDATPDAYSSQISHLFCRLAERNALTKDVKTQRASDLRLFSLITGVTDVIDIEQADLTFWYDCLGKIPTHFMKSSKDGGRTFEEIMMIAQHLPKEQRGLHPETIRRHMKSLELVIDRARAEGHALRDNLDLTRLKPKKISRNKAHKRRNVFREAEAKKTFAHSAWQGCKSHGLRHAAGEVILKDALYWIPLTLAYTGARRAEIAGLTVDDFEDHDGVPCIVIRANQFRGVKGDPEAPNGEDSLTRIVPIHSHLIELGLLDHVAEMRRKGHKLAFPDVVPKARKTSAIQDADERALAVEKFGESIDYMWRKALHIALDGNPRKLCMHSLRHYVNHTMIHTAGIHEVTRFDILGHVEDQEDARKGGRQISVNTNVYRDDTSVAVKKLAIEALPRLF